MISLLFTSLILVITITTLTLTLLLSSHRTHNKTKKKKNPVPPGRLGLPWIGETLDFIRAQKSNRLYQDFIFPRVQTYGKTFKTHLMGHPTVVVNGPHPNRFFLSNEFKLVVSSWPSSSVQLMGENSIMEKRGGAHRCLRGIIASTLGPTAMEDLVPRIYQTVRARLEKEKPATTVSLYGLAKQVTFTVVLECLLGIEVRFGMMEAFEKVLEGVFSFAAPVNFPWSKFASAKTARKEIGDMLLDIVRMRKEEMENVDEDEDSPEEERGVLLSRLVEALIRGEISEMEVVDNVVLLVFAAHDTTSFAIAMTFKMLAQNPDCLSILEKEHEEILRCKSVEEKEMLTHGDTRKMSYTWRVAQESMRMFPPIFGSFRRAIQDIEYDGYVIPKGWKVLWTACGTHCDKEQFEDPLRFKPSRFEGSIQPYSFVAFGGGPRLCAGYQLAKLNILIFVHCVVSRYDWSLVSPHESITVDPLPFPSQGMPITISPKPPNLFQ